jgi:hypothetical protein
MPNINFEEPIRIEIDHFIDCMENGTRCLTGVDHAKKVVEILASCGGSRATNTSTWLREKLQVPGNKLEIR